MNPADGNVIHTVGTWRHLAARAFSTAPRPLCGASLISETPDGDPGPDAPRCPDCVARGARAANTSWNLAFAALVVTAGVFLVSVLASACRWHPAVTGRTAGLSALAMFACGAWLLLSAARLEPLDPEPDERAECPYGCDHGKADGRPAS